MLDQYQSYLSELVFIIPELFMAVSILLLLLLDIILGPKSRRLVMSIALLMILVDIGLLLHFPPVSHPILFNSLFPNAGSVFFRLLADMAMLMVILFWQFSAKDKSKKRNSEYPFLFLSVLFASHILCISNSWLIVFLSIEMISISTYILIGIGHKRRNIEAVFKYLIFGALSTGIMLFGISFILAAISNPFFSGFEFMYSGAFQNIDLLSIGLIMALAGVFFKMSIFPFHFWAPDLYQGTSLPMMAMVSSIPKIAAFGFFASQFILIWPIEEFHSSNFSLIIGLIALVSMTWANLAALAQNNFPRLMAYSGIAQSGFMMLALVNGIGGIQNLGFFLLLYVFMNTSLFVAADIIKEKTYKTDLSSFSGLGKTDLWAALSILIALIALIGLPPTGGFTAKFIILSGAFEWYSGSGESIRIIIFTLAVINVVISLFYYLRIPYFMFFKEASGKTRSLKLVQKILIAFSVIILLYSFVFYEDFRIILESLNHN